MIQEDSDLTISWMLSNEATELLLEWTQKCPQSCGQTEELLARTLRFLGPKKEKIYGISSGRPARDRKDDLAC